MRVACFCGNVYEAEGTLAACPLCSVPATLPCADELDLAAMQRDLRRIIDDIEGSPHATPRHI